MLSNDRSSRGWVGVALAAFAGGALLAAPRAGAAQPSSESRVAAPVPRTARRVVLALSYDAAPGCPSVLEFQRALRQRNDRVVLATPGQRGSQGGRTARVHVWLAADPPPGSMPWLREETPGGGVSAGPIESSAALAHPPLRAPAEGRLTVDAEGERTTRDMQGESCAEVAQALAFSLAVTLETLGHDAPAPAAVPEEEITFPEPLGPQQRAPEWGFSAGGGLRLHTAIAPQATAVGVVDVAVSRAGRGPWLRVSASVGQSSTTSTEAGSARFLFGSGEPLGCPWGWRREAISWAPCGVIEIGALQGRGEDPDGVARSTGPWVAPGLAAAFGLDLGPIALGATWGVTFPLVRDQFYFQPDVLVHRAAFADLRADVTLAWAHR